jgi:hypothetical protein
MDETSIPFNKPYVAGKELYYIAQSIYSETSQPMDASRKPAMNCCAKDSILAAA